MLQNSRLRKQRSQERPQNVRNYRKNRKNKKGFFLQAKNIRDKYRKNRQNYKCNKIPDLEKEEVNNGLKMSANIAKIAKVTKFFLAS